MPVRSRAVNGLFSRRALVIADTTHCSISAPLQPFVSRPPQTREIEISHIYPSTAEVDFEDLGLLAREWQVHEKDLVETPLADHLG